MRNNTTEFDSVKKVGLYNPYLDTLGGGEKHILSILEVFAEQGFEVNIFWDKNLTNEIKKSFSFRCIDTWKWLPNVFKHRSIGNRILRLPFDSWFDYAHRSPRVAQDDPRVTFDYFFYVTDGSYFFSSAKKNFIYAMIPDKRLYQLSFLNRLKLSNFKFITHSFFVRNWLKKWDLTAEVIYPYLNDDLINMNFAKLKKEKIILSVGRFFKHLHAKRQDIIIKSFKKLQLKYQSFKDFKLYLVGGLKEEDKAFFNKLKLMAQDNKNIIFLPNASYKILIEYYKKAMFYWHTAGYRVDENKNPERVEHLGIAPLEAMASGCITFCHNSGGPKEIINNGVNGFLYKSLTELIDKTVSTYQDENKRQKIAENAKKYIRENFSYEVFRKGVIEFFGL